MDDPQRQRASPAGADSGLQADSFLQAIASAPERHPPPQRISHYTLLEKLGAGGMGEVYKAHDSVLDRVVALKILPQRMLDSPDRVRRFLQEAKAASALNHPNIVTIYEVGEVSAGSSAVQFIAMEFIDGETLRARLRRERDARRLLPLCAQVADGLAKAHAAGIVHRDLKPENIMVTHDGFAKVVDFGLAKLVENPLGAPSDATRPLATEAGTLMGTTGYMSPEQVRGETVDARSDIFSMGAILYEVLTGRHPFAGGSVLDTLHHIVYSEPPPVRELSSSISPELQRILRRCLAKDPEERYQSIKDLAIDLREAARPDAAEPAAPPAPAVRGRWLVLGLLLAAVLAGVVWGGYRALQRPAPAPRQNRIVRLTNNGRSINAAISPDGKYVAHVVWDLGRQSLWVRQVATTSNIQVVPPKQMRYAGLTFSPDGNYIYYVAQNENVPTGIVYRIPVLGGDPRKLVVDADSPVTVSPDGRRIAFMRFMPNAGECGVFVSGADGTGERKLASLKGGDQYGRVAWSPDGKRIATSRSLGKGRSVRIVTLDVETGAETPIHRELWYRVAGLAWLGDGSGLLVAGTDKSSRPSQIYELSYHGGKARRISNDANEYAGVGVTADSRTLVTVQADAVSNLWIVPVDDPSRRRPITSGGGKYRDVSWTRDGHLLVSSREGGNWDIWSIDVDGRNAKQLTADAASNSVATASPDGRSIVFVSDRAGNAQLWKMDRDGGNQRPLTFGIEEQFPSFTPDGAWVVYSSASKGKFTLWKVPAAGGTPVQVSARFSFGPEVSPDGRFIAFTDISDDVSQPIRFGIMPIEGGPLKASFVYPPTSITQVHWRPDGKALSLITHRGGKSNIFVQPLAGGPGQEVTRFRSDSIGSFAWSPDGKEIACVRGLPVNDVVLMSGFR
jgi:Tol biopolymer transport system component/tRNA A-37 threonylcarbamoyl transferase component Bud32